MARKQAKRKATTKRKSSAARKPSVRRARASASARRAAPSRKELSGDRNYLEKQLNTLMKAARSASTVAQIGALQTKQAAAKKALARLARQSAAAGRPIASGLQKAWRDIDLAVRQATRRFRETT